MSGCVRCGVTQDKHTELDPTISPFGVCPSFVQRSSWVDRVINAVLDRVDRALDTAADVLYDDTDEPGESRQYHG